MNCGDWVRIGYLVRVQGDKAQVNIQGETVEAQIVYSYGLHGRPPVTANTFAICFAPNNNTNNYFCIPFNLSIYPNLANGEIIIENSNASVSFSATGNITINASQDVTVNSVNATINASTQASIAAPVVNLADATADVLNANAVIQDSLGGACTITNAGQSKVKA